MNKTERAFNFIDETSIGLFTDLYELKMCASYFKNKKTEPVTFDLFIRKLPANRSYFVFAGLEQVLLFLKKLKFGGEEIRYLKEQEFEEDFLDYLRNFRFTGDVWAIPEGTIVFPNEPLIRVEAPIIEAQLIEAFILNTVNLQTMIATKASRVVNAAKGKTVIEFGLRRTQGTDAGMKAARCSYIAGVDGTSNVLAGMKYGIPISGTMAHSYVSFFGTEIDSFRAFSKAFPKTSTFLIDTYDTLKGAENASIVAKELEKKGYKLAGVRLDSGNLLILSQKVRAILDKNGLKYVQIFASGDLDEYKIDRLLEKGAKIDAFGVGTRMSTSSDRPYVDVVYKLAGKTENGVFIPTMKLSTGKITLPGKKQVFRQTDETRRYVKDVIGLENEEIEGRPLLVKVMRKGEISYRFPTLKEIRNNTLKNLSELPEQYKTLRNSPKYPVELSLGLKKMLTQLSKQLQSRTRAN
ncbi:nicotinate phosphoribosyltransferase [Candidatus Bathyarchaeota archaeon]|nr:nicotinate phosphoribosyltransferase [Candidatus Bathyarchaeota archaeon]